MTSFLKSILLTACLMGLGTARSASAQDGAADHTVAARVAVAELGKRLKGRLMSTMQSEGPVAAINVCAQEAYEIAAQVSDQAGMEVGRRALRLRNPGNAPDDWEQQALIEFLGALARGEDPGELERSEVRTVDGEEVFYWAKPILLQQPCTVCHGAALAPEVAAAIADLYPDDRATGFAVGELRGIFSVKKRLP